MFYVRLPLFLSVLQTQGVKRIQSYIKAHFYTWVSDGSRRWKMHLQVPLLLNNTLRQTHTFFVNCESKTGRGGHKLGIKPKTLCVRNVRYSFMHLQTDSYSCTVATLSYVQIDASIRVFALLLSFSASVETRRDWMRCFTLWMHRK